PQEHRDEDHREQRVRAQLLRDRRAARGSGIYRQVPLCGARRSRPERHGGGSRQRVFVPQGTRKGPVRLHAAGRLRRHGEGLRHPRGESRGTCGRAADLRPAAGETGLLVEPQDGVPRGLYRYAHRAGQGVLLAHQLRFLYDSRFRNKTMRLVSTLLLPLLALTCLSEGVAQTKGDFIVYAGAYTRPNKSKGIYAWRFQAATGKLTPIGLVGETASPSFLAVHPNHKFLYAVNEVSDYKGTKAGSVSSFALDAQTGML